MATGFPIASRVFINVALANFSVFFFYENCSSSRMVPPFHVPMWCAASVQGLSNTRENSNNKQLPPSSLRYIIRAAIIMIGVVLPIGYMMFRNKRVPSTSFYSKQTAEKNLKSLKDLLASS